MDEEELWDEAGDDSWVEDSWTTGEEAGSTEEEDSAFTESEDTWYDEDSAEPDEGTEEDGYPEDDDGSESLKDSVTSAIDISKEGFLLTPAVVQLNDLVIPVTVKDSRRETVLGLTQSVQELGVLNPIHVAVMEGYSDHLNNGGSPEEYEGPKYALIDGLRRVFAARKSGLVQLNAMVWDFKDKERGAQALTLLSLILNKHQEKSWAEIWYLHQVLEETSALTPAELEYLLSLEPGDATKLKEVMTRGDDFPEPRDDLLGKKKTLPQAYNALNKAMKDQNLLLKEDLTGVSGMQTAEGIVEEGSANADTRLTDEQVKELLDMSDGSIELQEDDFDSMLNNTPEVQTVGERHPLDPALKSESLEHDGYQCVCCGTGGKDWPRALALAVLQSHHKISVANGGPDSVENLATVCQTCHTAIHTLLWRGMKFGMSKEDFDNLPTDKRERWVQIMRIARVDYEAAKRLGKSVSQIQEANKHPSQFKMPLTDFRENVAALKSARQ